MEEGRDEDVRCFSIREGKQSDHRSLAFAVLLGVATRWGSRCRYTASRGQAGLSGNLFVLLLVHYAIFVECFTSSGVPPCR